MCPSPLLREFQLEEPGLGTHPVGLRSIYLSIYPLCCRGFISGSNNIQKYRTSHQTNEVILLVSN